MEESKSIIDELSQEALALADSRSKEVILATLKKINNRSDPEIIELFEKAKYLLKEYIGLKIAISRTNRSFRCRDYIDPMYDEYYMRLGISYTNASSILKYKIKEIKQKRNVVEKEIFDKTGIIYKDFFKNKYKLSYLEQHSLTI